MKRKKIIPIISMECKLKFKCFVSAFGSLKISTTYFINTIIMLAKKLMKMPTFFSISNSDLFTVNN